MKKAYLILIIISILIVTTRGEPVKLKYIQPYFENNTLYISLNCKDADIRDILDDFSKLLDLNIVLDPDVKGTVTCNLKKVPWKTALKVILHTNKLEAVWYGNVALVGDMKKVLDP